MKPFNYTFACVIILLLTQIDFAQNGNVNISGWVTDASTGEFLIGSNVLLYKDSISADVVPLKGTSTNQVGFYVLSSLSKGNYVIVFRNIGYKSKLSSVKITITKGTVSLNVGLRRSDVELEEIVISGKKVDDSKISTIEIPPEILSRLPSVSGEVAVFKSLEMLPGVKTENELSNGLYVRGGSPDQTLTLLDGVIVYNPAHLGNFSSTFNSNALQSVKLIKGAFPAEYGGRLSSVLDIKLRSGSKEKSKRMLSIGMISSNLTLEGPFSENSTYMLSGRTMYYDFYQKKFNKDGLVPRYNFYDLSGKLTYHISEKNILSISAMFNSDNLYSPPKSKDINYDIGWKNSAVSLNWLQINSESLLINAVVSYVNYQFKSILNAGSAGATNSNYFSSSKLRDLFFRVNAESNIRNIHSIKAGFELALHNYNLIYSNFYRKNLEDDPNINTDILATEAAIFIQDDWQVTPFLKTNFGSRFYYFKSKNSFKIEPRFSASLKISKNIFFKTAYAIAHQFLHLIVRNDISLPTDLWYPSTKVVEPSKSIQYIGGFDTYWLNKEILFSVEAYYKKMESLYEFKNAASIQVGSLIEDQFTKGEGEAYGIEFFLNKRAGNFYGWIGYTLSWTRRKFEDLNAGRVFYPRYDRRHDVSAVFAYNFSKNLSVGITWVYATGQGYTLPTGQYSYSGGVLNPKQIVQFNYTERNVYRLKAYHKMDFNLSYSLKWMDLPFEFYLNIYNVYNRSNPFAAYISLSDSESDNGKTAPVLKQLTLFPFTPTIGFNVKF